MLVAALGIGLVMAVAVDRGVYEHLPPWAHGPYLALAILLSVAGGMALTGFLAWFAFGPPEQQLFLPRSRRRD